MVRNVYFKDPCVESGTIPYLGEEQKTCANLQKRNINPFSSLVSTAVSCGGRFEGFFLPFHILVWSGSVPEKEKIDQQRSMEKDAVSLRTLARDAALNTVAAYISGFHQPPFDGCMRDVIYCSSLINTPGMRKQSQHDA